MFSGPWKRQVRLCPSFAQPRLAPAGTGRQGPFSFPLLAALLLGWITLRTARQLPRLNAQKFRKPGVSRRPWRLLATMPCRPPAWRKVALGLPTPLASLWLCSSLGGGAGARRARLGQGPLPARAPSRRPRPARPSSLQSNRSRLGPWQGQGPGESGTWDTGRGSPGRGKGGGRERPRLTERTRERRGCRWWSPPP